MTEKITSNKLIYGHNKPKFPTLTRKFPHKISHPCIILHFSDFVSFIAKYMGVI